MTDFIICLKCGRFKKETLEVYAKEVCDWDEEPCECDEEGCFYIENV